MHRARIMLIGQDRAGKTSLKKSFLGLPFDPYEQSTDGIEVDPSKFEIDVDQVKNWQQTDEKLSVSQFANDLAKMVASQFGKEGTSITPEVQDELKKTASHKNEVWSLTSIKQTNITMNIGFYLFTNTSKLFVRPTL